MNPKEVNSIIAHYCGWREAFPKAGPPHPETQKGGILLPYYWVNEKTGERRMDLPDYCNDLNRMHEAEKLLTHDDLLVYIGRLAGEVSGQDVAKTPPSLWYPHCATAAQRAESFLRTVGTQKKITRRI